MDPLYYLFFISSKPFTLYLNRWQIESICFSAFLWGWILYIAFFAYFSTVQFLASCIDAFIDQENVHGNMMVTK